MLLRSLKTVATASFGLAGANLLLSNRPREAFAHCQVPCGIFDDAARFKLMFEDIRTIKKAQGLVQDLSVLKDAQSIPLNPFGRVVCPGTAYQSTSGHEQSQALEDVWEKYDQYMNH
ncbi:hypothetical protein GUITHDRAFT_112465 [Guillardia theta CCMP2712]|uniref:Superoxide dismutase n=1 Tax=Guillardia theta (strain CCMP2712) TaxID=905079 RepID=L1IYZ2_GUITC|nr:hypothetical protein GUITHDRAFT_112465 [Guillardia theta CCMP2712]EKX41493.1 hypothetical protein GUITHDRAFT_112465 [Guillardia theta CCMP2712]|eukprot:XP_005828473.1 hypothetical protein GUITHDRAFT_112465 [Guillardia theta CCMP2712]